MIMTDERNREKNGADTAEATDFNMNTDENAAGTTHLNEPVENDDIVEKLTNDVAEQKDKYIRLLAEFENYKRRTSKERLELIQTAGKDIIISLLDVMDDADRAEKQMKNSNDINQVKEGVQLVFNKLRNTMQSKGLKAMDNRQEDFDVEKHEAITEIPAPSKSQVGKVLDEVQKGYYLNDKLIRFAKVVVGK